MILRGSSSNHYEFTIQQLCVYRGSHDVFAIKDTIIKKLLMTETLSPVGTLHLYFYLRRPFAPPKNDFLTEKRMSEAKCIIT